jgi:hypothetical protein
MTALQAYVADLFAELPHVPALPANDDMLPETTKRARRIIEAGYLRAEDCELLMKECV